MNTSHAKTAASVLELVVLHNKIFDAHSNCFSGDAVGPDDFANILLEDCKANDASPTDQNILDFTDICVAAYKEKKRVFGALHRRNGGATCIDRRV